MRMWMVKPNFLCRKHLLGEHRELHALVGILKRKTSIKGYIDKNLIEVHNIKNRHEALVKEMESRSYKHKSPLNVDNLLYNKGYVNEEENIKELAHRCPDCRSRINASKS